VSEVKAISVTQLARRIRNLLEIQVGEIWVVGEVSNVRKQSSGHWYFSLKDESAQISCAMFGARRRSGNEVIEDGAKVQVFGETSFYEARGSTQLIVKKVQAVGQGDLQARFESLKKKLKQEGLFDQERKKELPGFPKVIGIVTSPTGAALQDMKNVLSRRAPWLTVVLFSASVQGKGAERGIARAIRRAGNAGAEGLPQPEVLIVGRGGGSLEDLWNFNEEIVARAIADCSIPVVSAVGHEIDFTIADFVSDLRAPTPSAAAELVAPDQVELRDRLDRMGERLTRSVESRLDRLADQMDFYERGILGQSSERVLQSPIWQLEQSRRSFFQAASGALTELENRIVHHSANWHRYHPREVFRRRQDRLDATQEAFLSAAENALKLYQEKVLRLESVLHALGPNSILERGFSITFDKKGEIIKDPKKLKKGDRIESMLRHGNLSSRVE